MLRRLCVSFGCVAATACASVDDPPSVVSLDPYIGRLVTMNASVNGIEATMLFDTGGGVTAVTPNLAKRVDCDPHGKTVGHRMSGERVEFQKCGPQSMSIGASNSDAELYVFDLMALLPNDWPALDGIISLPNFIDHPFTLDLEKQQLILETKSSFQSRIANAHAADVRLKRDPGGEVTVFVRVEALAGDLWFLLDSANLDHVLVSPTAMEQLGVFNDENVTVQPDSEFTGNFTIAGVGSVSADARVRDIIYDGAFNEAVMRRYLITFDLQTERAWFSSH